MDTSGPRQVQGVRWSGHTRRQRGDARGAGAGQKKISARSLRSRICSFSFSLTRLPADKTRTHATMPPTTATLLLLAVSTVSAASAAPAPAFRVPPLPYNESALAPAVPEDTVKLHYGVHTNVRD